MLLRGSILTRAIVTLWMFYLGLGQADDLIYLMTHDLHETSLYDTTTTREPCQVCVTDNTCKTVADVFTREKMEEGYNFLATIPAGACNATVAEERKTKNILALRWKALKFNGDWMIKPSGNYSVGNNFFTYERPEDLQEENAPREHIRFTSQLTHGISVFLIVKENNPGVKFRYVLPPVQKPHASPTEAGNTTSHKSAEGTAGVKEQDDRRMAQSGGNIITQPIMQPYFRLAAGKGSSMPSWASDLQEILRNWKTQIEDQQRESNHLTELINRVKRDLNTKIDTNQDKITKNENEIKALEKKGCAMGTFEQSENAKWKNPEKDIYTLERKFQYGRVYPVAPKVAVSISGVGLYSAAFDRGVGSAFSVKITSTGNSDATMLISSQRADCYEFIISWIACNN